MPSTNVLPIRVCSPRKTGKARGYLHELYCAPMLVAFFKAFPRHAVLSRKLGICFWDKQYDNYGDCEEKTDGEILAMLREQAKDPALAGTTLVYWNHRPLTHAKWIRLLREAGFLVLESNTLAGVQAKLDGTGIQYPMRHQCGLLVWIPPYRGEDPPCLGHWPAPDGSLCDQCAMDEECQGLTFKPGATAGGMT